MQYLYYGGAESLLIKNNEIMEVRDIYLNCSGNCVPFTQGHMAVGHGISTPVIASSASPRVPRLSTVLRFPSCPVTCYGNFGQYEVDCERRKSRKIMIVKQKKYLK